MKKILSLFFFTSLLLNLSAQETVTQYFGNEELTCNLIADVCQDQDGNIWVGTLNGLNRYDGWHCKHIYAIHGDSTALQSNYVRELYSDSKGRLWVGTNLGLQLYDNRSGRFRSVHFPEGRSANVNNIVELGNGELWLVSGNIFRLDPESMSAEPAEDINKLTGSSATEVFSESNGTIWIVTNRDLIFRIKDGDYETIQTEIRLASFTEDDGDIYAASRTEVYRWDAQSDEFVQLANSCPPYYSAKLLRTHDGTIYLASNGQGFRKIDKEHQTVVSTDRINLRKVNLENLNIPSWIEDRNGNIWVCSAFNGLMMSSSRKANFTTISPADTDIPKNDMVNALLKARNSGLWAGTEGGTLYLQGDGDGLKRILNLPGSIYSLQELDDRYIIAGTRSHGLYKIDQRSGASRQIDGTQGLYVKKMVLGPDGNYVLSLFTQGISFFDTKSETLSGNIRAGTVNTILADRDGLVWCGTYNGVRCYNYGDRTERHLHDNQELDAAVVYSFYEGQDRKIWIGTSDGLFSYDKATEVFAHYRSKNLENTVICGIAGDSSGMIWASTFKGIVRFNPESGETVLFSSGQGLYDTEYIRGSYFQDPDSSIIYFGGQNDITAFNPSNIELQTFDMAPVLTGIRINGKPVTVGYKAEQNASKLNLSHKENNLGLAFSTMDFRETSNICTEYSFDRDTTVWNATSTGSNNISLDNLKQGRYKLRVRFDDNGIKSPTETILIKIRPAWYKSWIACIIYILAAVLIGFALISARRKAAERRIQQKADNKRLAFLTSLTRELRSPMTLVTAPLQMLTRNSYDDETDRELASVRQNAEKVVFLLDQSLEVSKIDEGARSLNYSKVNLTDYIPSLLAGFVYQARQNNIDVTFSADTPDLPVWIDVTKFDKAILYLASSICTNTDKGGSIDIHTQQNGSFAELSIKNTGRRVDKEHIVNMFDLSNSLELFLCKDIITQHKGSIDAADRSDREGAVFTISIPMGDAHIPKERIVSQELVRKQAINQSLYSDDKGKASGSRYSVIAIDENSDICRYLSKLLSPRFNVSTFTNASDGLNSALNDAPDLIITDMMMSGIDGISLIKKIKSNSNTAHVPVVLLTALPENDIKLKGLQTGADAIISKPFNEEELILVCTNLIMSRSRLVSHIKDMQITKEILQPVELQGNNDALMQKVITIINEHISDPELNVEMLADTIGMSRGHLHRKIKEITGSSPGDYIRAIRLNQAAQLLKGEKKNISQIAYSVGYNNPSVFSTAFKAFFGMSAKEYQKRYANSDTNEQQAG